MIIGGWIVWGLSLLWFLGFLFFNRKDAKGGKLIHVALLVQMVLLLFSITVFVFSSFNKLHLLWVVPSCHLLGLIIGFFILPVPLLGGILRCVLLAFAYVFFLGIDWQLGGYPWEISTARSLGSQVKAERYESLEEFEAAIGEREKLLFGYYLYYQGVKHIYNHDKAIMEDTEFHYSQMKERNTKAVSEAKTLLAAVKTGAKDIRHLREFIFPPIHGPGLDEMTERAMLLVTAYNKVFPGRPCDQELNEEEHAILINEVTS